LPLDFACATERLGARAIDCSPNELEIETEREHAAVEWALAVHDELSRSARADCPNQQHVREPAERRAVRNPLVHGLPAMQEGRKPTRGEVLDPVDRPGKDAVNLDVNEAGVLEATS